MLETNQKPLLGFVCCTSYQYTECAAAIAAGEADGGASAASEVAMNARKHLGDDTSRDRFHAMKGSRKKVGQRLLEHCKGAASVFPSTGARGGVGS